MLSCIGKTILLLAISGYGFLIKNSSLKKTEFKSNLEELLLNKEFTYKNLFLENCFDLLSLMIFLSILSVNPRFYFSSFFGGLALIVLNFVLNFDYVYFGVPSNLFIMMNFIAFGMLIVGLSCPKKNIIKVVKK